MHCCWVCTTRGVLVERCWRVVGRSGYVYKCEICRVDGRLQVRVRYGDHDLVHCEPAQDIETGRDLGQQWLRRILELEDFEESS